MLLSLTLRTLVRIFQVLATEESAPRSLHPTSSRPKYDYSRFYLLTWSRPTVDKPDILIPGQDLSKEQFRDELVRAYSVRDVELSYFCITSEKHADGTEHFHACTASPKRHRWVRIAESLRRRRINVNSTVCRSYFGPYVYCCKQDPCPILSQNHPAFPTNPTQRELKSAESTSSSGEGSRIRYLSDIAGWITSKRIRTEHELLQAASREVNVKNFLMNSRESASMMLQKVWSFEDAAEATKRSSLSRMSILEDAAQNASCKCANTTSLAISQILINNGIKESEFARAIINMLRQGRTRNCNIAIMGGSACGKSFLLKSLGLIYKPLGSLGSGSYPLAILVEDPSFEIMLLDDYRFVERVGCSVGDVLCLFEGKIPLTVSVPKSLSKCDMQFVKDIPLAITRPSRFVSPTLTYDDNTMLNERFHWFQLSHTIPPAERRDLPGCARCFARFLLSYMS